MSAAEKLIDLKLANDWIVVEHLARPAVGTGGNFSHSYLTRKSITDASGVVSHRTGFLKAFDFQRAFRDGVDTVNYLRYLTTAYEHEREILSHCKDRRLTNIVVAIDHGSVQVPHMGVMEGRVYYLIFEMATGDVRVQMDLKKARDAVWCMRALSDVSLGLWQIHKETIAHQDAKPSNVLSYPGQAFKVADFGRSARKGHPSPHDDMDVAGDPIYSPPELLYGYLHADFAPRRFGCDLYMLGNLAAFLFSGVNVTANLFSKLDAQHRPENWGSTYEGVLPYLGSAFTQMLADLRANTDESIKDEVVTLVRELCNPDLSKRGYPKTIGRHDQYSLERYVSRLDLISKRLSVRMRSGVSAA